MIGFSASDVAAFVERIQAEIKKNFIPFVATSVKCARESEIFPGIKSRETRDSAISIEIFAKNSILQK
jgi:hypothetical protein